MSVYGSGKINELAERIYEECDDSKYSYPELLRALGMVLDTFTEYHLSDYQPYGNKE